MPHSCPAPCTPAPYALNPPTAAPAPSSAPPRPDAPEVSHGCRALHCQGSEGKRRGGLCPAALRPLQLCHPPPPLLQLPGGSSNVRPAGGSAINMGVADKHQSDYYPIQPHPCNSLHARSPPKPMPGAAEHIKSRCYPLPEDTSLPSTASRPSRAQRGLAGVA